MQNSVLALRVREQRIRVGLTQAALARASGVPLGTVAKIEQGVAREPTIQTIAKLANALNCTIDELAKGIA